MISVVERIEFPDLKPTNKFMMRINVSKILTNSGISFLFAAIAALSVTNANAASFSVEIVVDGLNKPHGIVAQYNNRLFFSEVPVPGTMGVDDPDDPSTYNKVSKLRFAGNSSNVRDITPISEGEPYPINLAIEPFGGDVYWTCKTVGVILKYDQRSKEKSFFLPAAGLEAEPEDFLMSPSGVSIDIFGDVFFTELPMPGESGMNMVSVSDGNNISLISDGEPAPTDITVAFDGTAYWTCQTANVILKRSRAGVISKLLTDLNAPTGIAINRSGDKLYFTEVPTPGAGLNADDNHNMVKELNLKTGEISVVATGFPWPQDVTVATNGSIYWTCTEAGVIAKATRHGN